MATNNDDIKWLYGKLKARGYNVGTEQEFTSSLANEADRQWYYEKAKGMGLNMGSMADFNSLYAPARTTNPTASTQQRTASATASAARPAAPGKATPKYSSWPAGTPGNPVKPTSAPVAKNYNPAAVVEKALYGKDNYIPQVTPFETPEQRKNRRETMRKVAYPTPQEKKEAAANLTKERAMSADGTRLEWLELKARQGGLSEAEKKEYNALATDEVSRTRSASDKRMQEQVERSKRLTDYSKSSDGDFTRRKYDPVRYGYGLNPQTGILEAQYLTHDGRIVFGESGKIQAEAEAIPFREQMERKDELEEMEARMAEIDEELKELRHQKDEAENGDVEGESFLDKFVRIVGGNASRGYGVPGTVKDLPPELTGVARTDLDQRIHDLQNEYLLLDRAHTMKLREQEKGGWEFGRDMLHGAKDAFTWNLFGDIIDISLAADAWSASKKDNRTDSQDRMLEAFVKKSEYDSHDKGIGYHLTNLPLSFMSDPLTYASGGIGSIAGKGAEKIVKKVAVRQAEKAIGSKVGKWVVEKALTTRLLPATVGSAVNLGVYNAGSSMRDQYIATGEVNSGEVLKSSAIGVGTGIILGPMGSIVGNVGDKAVRSTSSIAGKMAIRGVQYPVSTVLEGTVFAIPGWMSGEGDPMDVWVEGMATAAGFKGTHAIKSAPRVIRGLKGDGRRIGKGVEERVRDMLDRDIPEDMQLTKDELAEIRDKGYGRLADLFRKRDNRVYEVDEKGKKHFIGEAEEGSNENVREIVKPGEESGKHDFKVKEAQSKLGEDGYDVMEEFIGDSRVSQATRAKAYWLLTGHRLAPSPIIGYREYTLEDGRHFVEAVAVDGNVVTLRQTKPGAETKREVAKIKRQAELNGIQVGEWFAESEANRIRYGVALEEVSREYGSTPERIAEVYNRVKEGKGQTTDAEQKLVEKVDEALEHAGSDPRVQERDPENIRHRIEEELEENYIFKKKKHDYVEVDNALRKPIEKRSEREQEAVEQYLKELYGGREWRDAEENEAAKPTQEQNAAPTQAEEEARSRYEQGRLLYGRFEEGDETAQADIDAIALRMQEAYDILNEAFGAEAEYYIYQVNKNPWRLVNDPELTIERRDAVLYYINAKAAIDGVMDASNEATDRKRVEVRQSVAKRTHKDNGVIIPATMKVDDRPVYVVKGEVVMFPDGTAVDVRNSSESIIVMDAQTGEYEFTSPDQIFKVSDAVNPQDELDAAMSAIERERMDVFGENAVASGETAQEEMPTTADKAEYDREYEAGLEEAKGFSDEQLNDNIETLRSEFDTLTDAGRGMLEAYEYEQQRRAMEAMAAPDPNVGLDGPRHAFDNNVPNQSKNVPTSAETPQNPTGNAVSPVESVPNVAGPVENVQETPTTAPTAEPTPLQHIPRDAKGEPIFEQAENPEHGWDALVEFAEGDAATAKEIADTMAEEKRKAYEKAQKQKPKGKTPTEILASKKAISAGLAQAEQEYNLWQQMANVEQRRQDAIRAQQEAEARQRAAERAEAEKAERETRKSITQGKKELEEVYEEVKECPEALAVLGHMEPMDMHEAAAVVLMRNKVLMTDDGVRRGAMRHTGYGQGEMRKMIGLFARSENGGKSLEKLSEDALMQVCDEYGIPYDNQEGFNAMLDVLHSIGTRGDLFRYIQNRRISQARENYAGWKRREQEARDEWAHRNFGMGYDDYEAYEEVAQAEAEAALTNFDEARYNAEVAEDMERIEAEMRTEAEVRDIYAREALEAIGSSGNIDYLAAPKTIKGNENRLRGDQADESAGEGESGRRGDEVLSESRTDQGGRETAYGYGQGVPGTDGVSGTGADAALPAASRRGVGGEGSGSGSPKYDRNVPATREAQRSAISCILDFAKSVKNRVERAVIGGITKRQAKDFAEIGVAVDDTWVHSFESSAVTHNQKHHGNPAAEVARGQVAITAEDYNRIPEILNDYDNVSKSPNRTKGTENDVIIYEKEFDDGYVYYLEEKRDNRRSLAFHTMYKKKRGTDSSDGFAVDSTAPITPKATPDNLDSKSERKDNNSASIKQGGAPKSSLQTSDNKGEQTVQTAVEAASAQVNTEPTPAQAEAGNYKKGHVTIGEFDITIENPAGSVRKGVDADGKEWSNTMANTYGYIKGTEGVDGDHIDVFLHSDMDQWNGRKVFVVDQTNTDGSFDEHKVMLGFNDKDEAMTAYLANYDKTWADTHPGLRISETNIEDFNKWVQSSRRKTKPFAEYKSVKPIKGNGMIGRSLTEQEATELIARMEASAEVAPTIELTPENWIAQFGEDGTVETPIGAVKMGENQYFKMARQGREGKLGMVKPTLQNPDVVVEDYRPATVGGSERDTSYIFVKTFSKEDGSRYYYFTSVTVRKEGREVVISNQERSDKRISKLLQQGKVAWIDNGILHPKAQVGKSVSLNDSSNPTNSDNGTAMLGVNSSANNEMSPSSELRLTEAPSESEGPDLVPTSDDVISSDRKVNTLSADKQAESAESSEPYTITATTYTNKKGKTSDVHLVKFNRELTAEEKAALDTFTREPLTEGKKTSRGWYDRKQGGYMMRSEEAARELAEMIGNEEAVADAQPMTAEELREAVGASRTRNSKPKKAPVNRVSLEDVMTDLSTKGETKLSDHAEPVKAEPEQQHEISDDEMQSLADELHDLLGIGDYEGDTNIKFRDPGELTPQERQRIQSAGLRLAMGLVERGTTSFPDFATKMVVMLGDKIRPWLKAFYEGARWTPGYDKYTFTPTEQVATFDVQNFDKKQADPIAQAAMIVEERKASTASAQAQTELTETRNKNRRENDKQTEADTAALAEKAEAVADEAEVTAQSAGTGEAGRKRILRDLKRVDDTLEEVNDQLAILGYYEAEEVDKDFNEAYGYMRNAEKKAVKDAVDLAKQLLNDLGLGLDKVTGATTPNRDKRKNAVTANIAPAGGDISIRLPLNEGRELYITIGLDPSVTPGDVTYSGDNLQATRIMYRVEWPDEKGHVSFDRAGRNCWADANVTYADLLKGIQREAKEYLLSSTAAKSEEIHNGYKIGDEVLWNRYGKGKWEKVKIEDFDTDGSPIFEAVKGIMSEKGDWERIKPVDGIFGEAQRVARAEQEKKKKATADAVAALTGNKSKKSRKKDVTLKPDKPIGSLFADLNEEPQKQESNERSGNRPSKEVAEGELAHPVGTDATGTDGRLSSAGAEPTDKRGAAYEAGTGVERGADRPAHGTDEDGGLQPFVGNRGHDESGTDSRGNDSAVERGRTAGAGSVSERGTDRGTERLSEGESSSVTGRGSRTPAVKKPKKPEVKYIHNFRYDEENVNEADTYTPSQRLEANVKAIETLADVLFGDKPATDEQKAIMSRFRGWGQVDLGKYYDIDQILRSTPENSPISRLARVIKRLDPSGDKKLFDAIKRASLSSYYTPTPIARAMNSFLALAGYRGGSLLDPSMGNGMFEGTLPKSIQERTSITGVELDWLSGQLSRALYPDANVMINAFEKSGIVPGSFDVVTSNVPFGDIVVNDPTWKNDGTPLKRSAQNRIHNYYAVKMLEATRPGGLVAMMTTSAVMDTQSNQNIRAHIADQGEILGAIRLPDNTFQGTGVVTDIIFVRKWRDEQDREQTRADESYMETERAFLSQHEKPAPNKLDGSKQQVSFNGYYNLNPRNLIGEIQAGNQYGKKDAFGLTSKLTVDEIASEVEKAIKRIVGSRRGSLFNPSRTIRETQQAIREAYKGNGDWVSNGNLVVQDGKVGVLTAKSNEYGDVTRTFEGSLKHDRMLPRIEAMIELRTKMKTLIAFEIEGEKEHHIAAVRVELQKAYDNFVGKFGRLQDKDNSFILDDIDGYTLQALEIWKNGKFVGLSDIFTKNSIKPSINLEGRKTPQEAVALSLAEYGYLRPDYLAKALGEDWVEQCGDVVFLKPNSEDDYVTRDEYLSGDVVTKLADARAAAEKDKSFERNVKALEEVQPERIPFDDITIHLGARWIPEEVLNDFVNELLGIHAVYSNRGRKWDPERKMYVNEQKSGVRYIPETDSFEINIEKKELGGEASDWETPKKSAKEILQAALEDKTLVITYKDKEGNTHVDDEQTELANQKIADLRERFEKWLPSDPARVDLMEQLYNDRFNRTVIRHFDGSHLIVPGLMGKELRPHQKDAVWMLINNRGGIVDHIVGAGKTLVMQSAIMEMRRMGIAKKPMIVALKSTVAQIAREFKEAFPSARVLAPNDSDFKKENRKKFIANISLNDYDCVILSHEQYCMLPHTEEAERTVIDEQMWQLDNMIEYLYGTNDTSQMTKKQIKALEKRRENLKARLEKRLDRAVDREFCFENLGVDYLFVDESHQFKALPYVTSYQKVAGLGDPQGSNRAVALLTGIRHLQRMHQGDKGTVFLSGTTITNSLVETYNLLNYLRPRKLEELGMPTFDAWASTFAVHTSELEATITGGFALKDRFRQFDNVAELSQLYAEIADVRNDQNLKLPKPGIDAHTVIVPASDAMSEINSEIVNMIETRDGKYFGIYPKDPNRAPWGLHASTISAKAAVSPRLIFPDMDDDGGKVHAVCENVKKYYDEMAEQRGVQLIFCEMGVPGKGKEYDAYTDMVNRFVNDYGIPRSEIAYIQEAPTEEKRKDLFQRVRDGKVRILIGGTKNMGTGVNVQDRITDMHMLTVPWTPAALEQCIGRGGRQGNLVARDFMNNKVRVHYYATEGSLDLYKYQLLDAKGKMITQFKMGTVSGTRSFDEGSADEDGNMDPAEMVAILSGNPVIFEKAKQEKLVKKLRALRNGFERDYQRKKAKYDELQRRKENLERLIRLNDRDRADLEREGFKPDDKGVYPSTVTINDSGSYYGGRTFDKPKEAGEYLLAALDKGKTVTLQGFGQRARVAIVNEEKGNSLFSFRELEIGEGNERSIRYSVRLSDDATAAGTAYRNLLKRIMDNGDVYRHALEEVKSQLSGMNIGDGVFPRQAEYEEANAKLKELTAEFNKLGKKQETNGDGNKYRDGEELGEGERLRAIRALEPIEVERNELSRSELFAEYRALPDVMKEGYRIQFLRTAFGKNYKAGGLFAQVVPQLDELLSSSVMAYSEKDSLGGTLRPDGTEHKAHPNVASFDNYVNKAIIDGQEYYVRMTVQKTIDSTTGLHSCFVSNVDVYEKTATGGTDSAILRRPKQPYDGIVDAKLQQFFERASSEANILDMRERVQALSERSGVPVRVVTDASELSETSEDGKPRYSRRERRAKGWWSSKDDEVVIVLPNNVNVADVDNTFVHEVVGHKGLRALIGEERFDEFLGEIYGHASSPIRKVIDKMTDRMVSEEADRLRVRKAQAHERAGEDVNANYYPDMAEARVEAEKKREEFRKEATEEYISDLGGRIGSEGFEKMSRAEQTLWGKIKAKVQAFLDKFLRGLKIAKSIRLNDKDLSYILFKSWKNLRDKKGKGGVFADAEDAVMRRRTGWDDEMLSESAKIEDANKRFNKQVVKLTQENADKTVLSLGHPSKVLLSAGVKDKPMKLYGNKIMKKIRKHGFALEELKDLPKAVAAPITVFNNYNRDSNRSILTELKTKKGNFLVTIEQGKDGDIDFNIVSSVFGKGFDNIVDWYNKGYATFIDKEKALAFLSHQSAPIAATAANVELYSAAKVIKSFENPTFDEEDIVRFRDGADYVERDPTMARGMYEKRLQTSMYQFTEAMQDSMRGLMEFYKAVESKGAKRDTKEVSSFENAYIAENAMSSKSNAEMDEYENRILRPLLDIAARIAGNKRGMRALTDYMMAKHGLERNAYMRDEAVANGEESERDFAGLCGLTGEQDWKNAEAAAQRIVDDYEAEHNADIPGLWDAVNKATKTSLKKVYDCGLLTKDQYEKIRDMYQYYIPLRGFDEKTSDDVYGYLTSKNGGYNSPIKKAEGRKSKADDPLATIAYMAQNSILQGNRNLMKQKFLTYVLNHPSDLASVSRLWLVHDDSSDTWKPVFAEIDEGMTASEIEQEVEAFEHQMENLSKADPDKYKRGRDAIGIPYRLTDGNIKEHQVVVKRNGESFVITINGNPRAAQAVNGLTNPDNDLNGAIGKVFKAANYVNRQLSQLYTTRNPEFTLSNFIRDLIYANTMVHVKESQSYATKFHINHVKVNPLRMWRLFYLYQSGKLNMRKPVHRMFYEFMHWGGETGYTMQRDLEQEKKRIYRLIRHAQRWKLDPRRAFSFIANVVDIINRGIENSARFAAFITSRENGRDVQRSVYDAKEISVNFNKKGSGSKFMDAKGQTFVGKAAGFTSGIGRSFYVFWNAGVQGTVNYAKAFKKHPAKAIMATTALMLLGYFMAALLDDGDDEDKNGYYNISKYKRRSNLMFRLGDQWFTIPLPVEYRALYGLGELAYGVTSGREEYSDMELAKETASQLSQILPLDFMEGGGGLHAFVPSAFKPLVETETNKSWNGLPIYKDTPFNKDMPNWTKTYPRTNRQLIALSKWANKKTGGNDYKPGFVNLNPAKLEYLLNGYLGGYSNVSDKLIKTGETMLGEREYDPSSILFVNRLVTMGDERSAEKKINSDFFKYLEEYKRTHFLLRKYEDEADRGSDKYRIYLDALRHSRDGARHEVMDKYISKYNRLNRSIKDPDITDEKRTVYENEMRRLKRYVVSMMRVAQDSVKVNRIREQYREECTRQ